MPKRYWGLAPLAAVTLLAAPAVANDLCDDFTAYYRIHDVFIDDRGEAGPGPGDVRHGSAMLFDADDAEIGAFFWKSTLMPRHAPNDDADAPHPLIVSVHTLLPDGEIVGSGVVNRADTRSTELATSAYTYAVTGGTGAYAGAHGVLQASTVEGEDRRTLSFTIDCED